MGQSLSEPAPGLSPGSAPAGDFFICDFLGPPVKDDMASMEHPLFTLATRPDRRILRYAHGAAEIEVTPSVKGLPTVHDKDVLIFCVSQLMAAVNAGRPTSPVLHLKAHDLLLATNRETSGDGYRRLREALERLSGARIVTNLATGGIESTRGFGLIDAWEILRKRPRRPDDPRHRDAVGLDLPLGAVEVGADAQPRLLPAAQAARAPGLRDRAQALRPADRVADRARDAAEEVRLDLPAPGVPQDDPRHGRGGRAARLQPARSPRATWWWCARAAAASGQGRRTRGSAPEAHARARRAAPGYDPYWLEAEWLRFWRDSGRPALREPRGGLPRLRPRPGGARAAALRAAAAQVFRARNIGPVAIAGVAG